MDYGKRNATSEFSYILQSENGNDYSPDDENGGESMDSNPKPGGGGGIVMMENETANNQQSQPFSLSLSHASFNYINAIIGSGVIGIPYALHRAGFGLGFLLLILVAVVTDYSLILMIKCGHLCGRFSYPGIMEAAYGKYGYYLLSLLQFMYPLLAMISYNVVVGDTLSKVLVRFTPNWESSMPSVRMGVVLFVTVSIVIPLCLYKNLSRLARVSFLSLSCIVIILFTVIIKYLTGDYKVPYTNEAWRFAYFDIIPALGIMAFAFMCHHNTFLMYQSIECPSLEKWEKVTKVSVGFATVVSVLFGIFGYATFREFSQGDLLENYCWDDDLMNLSRILFSISILLTFPIECFASREIVKTIYHRYILKEQFEFTQEKDVKLEKGLDNDTSTNIITLAIVFLAFVISPLTECLGPILELNGLLTAIPLAYLLPGLAYIQMAPYPLKSREKLPALGLVVFGSIITFVGAALMIPRLFQDCKSDVFLEYCNMNVNISSTSSSILTKNPN
ncbi:SLC38A11 family protein [Megaselia abdita]